MGILDSLFKSGKQTTTQSLPGYVTGAAESAASSADAYKAQGPQFYEGDRVADLTPDQMSAFGAVSDRANQGVDLSEALRRMFDGGAAPASSVSTSTLLDPTNGHSLEEYFNPYRDEVVAKTLAAMDRDRAVRDVGINAEATRHGAFNDARHGVAESMNASETLRNKGLTAAQLYDQMFNTATAQKSADANRFLSADTTNAGLNETALARLMSSATGLANLSEAEINQILKLAGGQEAVGAAQQTQQQNEIDALIQKFTEGRDYNKDIAAFMAAIAGGLPAPVTTETKTKSNPLSSLAGLLGAGLKAYNQPA